MRSSKRYLYKCKKCGKRLSEETVQWFSLVGIFSDLAKSSTTTVSERFQGAYCHKCYQIAYQEATHICGECGVSFLEVDNQPTDICYNCKTKTHKFIYSCWRGQILRAKKLGLPATLTLEEWERTLRDFNYRCAYCGRPYRLLEHYINIADGGGTTVYNCLPACYDCNSTGKNRLRRENPITDNLLREYLEMRRLEKGEDLVSDQTVACPNCGRYGKMDGTKQIYCNCRSHHRMLTLNELRAFQKEYGQYPVWTKGITKAIKAVESVSVQQEPM